MPFRFLDLPGELRNMIYKEVLTNRPDIKQGRVVPCSYAISRHQTLGLLRVNKQVHDEGLGFFWLNNTHTFRNARKFAQAVSRLPRDLRARIRGANILSTPYAGRWDDMSDEELLGMGLPDAEWRGRRPTGDDLSIPGLARELWECTPILTVHIPNQRIYHHYVDFEHWRPLLEVMPDFHLHLAMMLRRADYLLDTYLHVVRSALAGGQDIQNTPNPENEKLWTVTLFDAGRRAIHTLAESPDTPARLDIQFCISPFAERMELLENVDSWLGHD